MAIYHSPDLPPTHHYLAYYRWLRDEFGAHAVLHMGKHGNLEWLPGKATALSAECYPEIMLSDLPNFYPYIINNPGEGTQAKRRAHAVIIDHLIPPMTQAETYDDLARLEQLLDEYYRMASLCLRSSTRLGLVLAQARPRRWRPARPTRSSRLISSAAALMLPLRDEHLRQAGLGRGVEVAQALGEDRAAGLEVLLGLRA